MLPGTVISKSQHTLPLLSANTFLYKFYYTSLQLLFKCLSLLHYALICLYNYNCICQFTDITFCVKILKVTYGARFEPPKTVPMCV
jgi:hypothetical protein